MPNFINGAMLLFSVLIGVPVLIHLFKTSRPKPNVLPTLDFLVESKHVSVREPKIVRRILLAIRIALVLVIVIAFARPQMRGLQNTSRDTRSPVSAAILIDNSPSMQRSITRGGKKKTSLEFAVSAAGELIKSLPKNSNVHLTTTEGAVWSSNSKKELLDKLASITVDAFSSSHAQGINECQNWLVDEPPSRELYVVSDFQASSWEDVNPSGTTPDLRVYYLELADEYKDFSVDSVKFAQRHISIGEAVELRYEVSSSVIGSRMLSLYLDGEKIASRNIVFNEVLQKSGSFELNFKQVGPNKLQLVFEQEDDFALNNSRSIIANVNAPSRVLVINSDSSMQATSVDVIMLALFPPDVNNSLGLMPQSAGSPISPETLSRVDCLILLSPSSLRTTDLGAISQFIHDGGGALIFADSAWRRSDVILRDTVVQRLLANSDARLTNIDYSHPIFSAFADDANGMIELTRFKQISSLNTNNARSLAEFSTGGAACVEFNPGRGRLIIFGAEPNELGGSFYREPPFLPFLHEATSYLKGLTRSSFGFAQGRDIELSIFEHDITLTIKSMDKTLATPLEFSLSSYDGKFAYRTTLEEGGYVAEFNGGERKLYFTVQPNAQEFDLEISNPLKGFTLQSVGTKKPSEFASLASAKRGGVEINGVFSRIGGVLFLLELVFAWHLTRRRSASSGALLNRSGGV